MPTLNCRSISISIKHVTCTEDDVTLALGIFVDGASLLTPLMTRVDPAAPPDHVLLQDERLASEDIIRRLQPALEHNWPVFWYAEPDEEARIVVYPNSFFHVLNPNYSMDWDDVLPGLAADSRQHFLREVNGAYGQPMPDPDHQFEGDPEGLMTIHVFVDPWCMGRTPAGAGGIGFQGLVRPQELRTFLSELESERNAMFSVLDDGA